MHKETNSAIEKLQNIFQLLAERKLIIVNLLTNTSDTKDYYNLFNPFDNTFLSKVGYSNPIDLKTALENCNSYKSSVSKDNTHKRSNILKQASFIIRQLKDSFAEVIALEGGKPLKDALIEVERAATTLETASFILLNQSNKTINLERTGFGHIGYLKREPIGTVLCISAFNHPLNLVAHQLGLSYAAGNATIIKSACQTPISAYLLAFLLLELGANPKSINYIIAKGNDVANLAESSEINYLSFIGSEKVGWQLRRKIANGTKIGLELGGIATCVLDSAIDLSKVLDSIVKGAFYHAGQVCVSTQVLFVNYKIYNEVKSSLIEKISKLKTGNPLDITTDVGPIISQTEIERVNNDIKLSISSLSQILIGGDLKGNCLIPTLVEGVAFDKPLMQNEVFAPVLALQKYDELDEVISYINSLNYGFQNSIFTTELEIANRFANSIYSKAVLINEMSAFRIDSMPFGGVKSSGLGIGGVEYTIEDMSYEKLIITKPL